MTSRIATAVITLALLALLVPAGAHAVRSCKPVKNPYAGTRYDGVDLTHIRASRVSCRTARRVAKGAHRKALGLTAAGERHPPLQLEGLEREGRPAPSLGPLPGGQGQQARPLALLNQTQDPRPEARGPDGAGP